MAATPLSKAAIFVLSSLTGVFALGSASGSGLTTVSLFTVAGAVDIAGVGACFGSGAEGAAGAAGGGGVS